jgi:dienelactone hydrolase
MNKRLIFFILSAGLLAGMLFFMFYPIAQFPTPSGRYGVGYATYHWVDQMRHELNAQDPQHPYRELMVHVFYPTEKNVAAKLVAYDQDAAKSTMEYFAMCSKLPKWFFSSLKLIKTQVQPGAPSVKSATPLPVVIFSPGAGGPMVQSYTWMLEELASQGFVVVGINHPYVAQTIRYPDGRVIASVYRKKARDAQWKLQLLETNAQDISFAITKMGELFSQKDSFWSNIDCNKIGMLGHSFGGRTTVRATRKDSRIKCGINLEGGIQDDDTTQTFTTPFMFVIAEKSFLWNKDHPQYKKGSDLDPILRFANTKDTNMKMVTIKDVGHSVFSDAPLQLNMTLFGRFISRYALFGLESPADKATDVLVTTIMPHIINFFDEHLKDKRMMK